MTSASGSTAAMMANSQKRFETPPLPKTYPADTATTEWVIMVGTGFSPFRALQYVHPLMAHRCSSRVK
jgi:hypothetical protein